MTKRKALGSGLEALLSAKPVNKNTQILRKVKKLFNFALLIISLNKNNINET